MANDETTGFNDRWPVDLTARNFSDTKAAGTQHRLYAGQDAADRPFDGSLRISAGTVLDIWQYAGRKSIFCAGSLRGNGAVDLVFWFVLPPGRRKAAIALYDENVAAGYSYYGMLPGVPRPGRKSRR